MILGGFALLSARGVNDPATTIGPANRFLKGRSAFWNGPKTNCGTCLAPHKRCAKRGGKPRITYNRRDKSFLARRFHADANNPRVPGPTRSKPRRPLRVQDPGQH